MKPNEIESWALRVLENVKKGLAVEDSRVELKSEWPEPGKASRRLAGHANAARGESILWLIGVDEKKGVVGASYQELSNWFGKVRSTFEGVSPDLLELNVECDGKTVAALCFDTTRAPYVVRNPAGGAVAREVPWREGTSVRTATRNDLILLLSPLRKLPKLEPLRGEIRLVVGGGGWGVRLELYVTPSGDSPTTFAFHRCSLSITAGSLVIASDFVFRAHPNDQANVVTGYLWCTPSELVMRGPGLVVVDAGANADVKLVPDWPKLELSGRLYEPGSEALVTFACEPFIRQNHPPGVVWVYRSPR